MSGPSINVDELKDPTAFYCGACETVTWFHEKHDGCRCSKCGAKLKVKVKAKSVVIGSTALG